MVSGWGRTRKRIRNGWKGVMLVPRGIGGGGRGKGMYCSGLYGEMGEGGGI